MPGNSFGQIFRIHTFGESHGSGLGVIIDGCPAGLKIDHEFINRELSRRRPGQSDITTSRSEEDICVIQSGVFEGVSTGTPISIYIPNKDHMPSDYDHLIEAYRPSHADMTYEHKYGIRDHRGGGRSSARETVCRVAAGAVAKLLLKHYKISVHAGVTQVGHISTDKDIANLHWQELDNNIIRCPDPDIIEDLTALIRKTKENGDTIGGKITCVVINCPSGLGEPVFDKLHADLGKAMLSINAVKGFEYGSGFSSIFMNGSEHNDIWESDGLNLKTKTNHSGGIQGGISNGMPIYFNVAFKPVATIMKTQTSIDKKGKSIELEGKGRHDPCVVPRAVPIVEAMAALVLADHLLRVRVARI